MTQPMKSNNYVKINYTHQSKYQQIVYLILTSNIFFEKILFRGLHHLIIRSILQESCGHNFTEGGGGLEDPIDQTTFET